MKAEQREKRKFGEVLRDNLQKITIVLVSIVYITQGIFELAKKDASILEILGSIFLSVVVGTVISSNLSTLGLKDGRNSETFQNSLKSYGEAKAKATPNFDKLVSWCDYKNFQELELEKKDIIQSAGLNWRAYKYGYYDEHNEKLDENQKKALERAKHCSIIKLNSQDLFSDLSSTKHGVFGGKKIGDKFGLTEKEFKTKSTANDLLIKVSMAVISGLYTLAPLITGENALEIIAGVIWNLLQVLIWLALGTMKYTSAKSFMEDEYRKTHIIQKTEYLNEFIITMQNNPKVIEEFDDSLEIDAYIESYLEEKERLKNINKVKKEVTLVDEQETVLD